MATVEPAPARHARPAEEPALRGAARHGVTNLVGVAVAAVLAFSVNIVVTTGWSKADAGLFFSVVSLFVIAYSVARLGTPAGTVYFVSRYRTLGQPHRIGPVLLAATVPVALVGALLAAGAWIAAPWLATRFQGTSADAVPMLRTVGLFIPVAALADTAVAACRGFGRMRPLLLIERVGRNVVQFVAVGLVAAAGASITVLPAAWVGPYLPTAALGLLWLYALVRRTGRAGTDQPGDRPPTVYTELGPFWRYAGPRALSTVAQAAIQRLDIVLLAALRSTAEAAVYTAATRFMILGQLAQQAVAAAIEHRISERVARGDVAGVGRLYQAATGWVVLLAWPTYLLFATYADPVLRLFGPDYVEGREVTVVLAVTMLVATGCGMVDTVLNMAGRTLWTFYNALAALGANVTIDLLLIPRWGVMGAAVGWSAAILVGNLVPLAQLYASMRLHPFGRGMRLAAALALCCFGVPAALGWLVDGGLALLVTLNAVGAVGYAVAIWRLRGPLELDGLVSMSRARRGGQARKAS